MKIIKRIEKAEITICTVLYAAMVLICFANVCSRFLFHFSFAFAEELELIAFIWSIMLGIAIGYNKGVHLGVSFLTDLLKGVPKAVAVAFSGAVSAGLERRDGHLAVAALYPDFEVRLTSNRTRRQEEIRSVERRLTENQS